MSFDPAIEKAMLDWVTGVVAPTRPTALFVQWATASPTFSSAFDGPFSPRIRATFAAAASPGGSATLVAAITGTATAAATAVGWNIYESNAAGRRLAYGTLSAAVGCKSADNPAFDVGALIITLS